MLRHKGAKEWDDTESTKAQELERHVDKSRR